MIRRGREGARRKGLKDEGEMGRGESGRMEQQVLQVQQQEGQQQQQEGQEEEEEDEAGPSAHLCDKEAALDDVEGVADVALAEHVLVGLVLDEREQLGDAVQLLVVEGLEDRHLLQDPDEADLRDVTQQSLALLAAQGVADHVGDGRDRGRADLSLVQDGPLAKRHPVDQRRHLSHVLHVDIGCAVFDEVQHVARVALVEDRLQQGRGGMEGARKGQVGTPFHDEDAYVSSSASHVQQHPPLMKPLPHPSILFSSVIFSCGHHI